MNLNLSQNLNRIWLMKDSHVMVERIVTQADVIIVIARMGAVVPRVVIIVLPDQLIPVLIMDRGFRAYAVRIQYRLRLGLHLH